MIKLNELRLGNLVWLKSHHYPVRVEEMFKSYDDLVVLSTDLHSGEKLEDYEGIPLTEEILIKAGFEKKDYVFFIGHHGFCLAFDGQDYCLHQNPDTDVVIAYCRFLHQLQNLYFLIRGKELNIEL
jgi:hypothetical protein